MVKKKILRLLCLLVALLLPWAAAVASPYDAINDLFHNKVQIGATLAPTATPKPTVVPTATPAPTAVPTVRPVEKTNGQPPMVVDDAGIFRPSQIA